MPDERPLGKEDYDQATWLARVLDHSIRYDYATKFWHVWNGVRWAKDQSGEVVRIIEAAVLNRIMDITSDSSLSKTEIGDGVKTAQRLKDRRYMESALFMLAAIPGYGTDGSDWDQDPFLLGCENGIVDLRTNTLDEHPLPSCLVTKTTGHVFVPFEIDDPNKIGEEIDRRTKFKTKARFENAPGSFWEFLTQVTSGDRDLSLFYLQWFGSSLFGVRREQRFLILTGVGRNGKGALAKTMRTVFGEYSAKANEGLYMRSKYGSADSSRPRADLMTLKGTRLAIMSEPEGGEFNEELLKAHTGGDPIVARALQSNNVVTWTPTHSVTFLTNEPPKVRDIGPSMQARVMVAPFKRRYEGANEDKMLYDRLEDRAADILAVLVWAGTLWNNTAGGLILPKAVLDESRDYMEASDPFSDAIREAFVVERGAQGRGKDMYDTYLDWHAKSGRSDDPATSNGWAMALEKKGFVRQRKEFGSVWNGIRPKTALETAEDDG